MEYIDNGLVDAIIGGHKHNFVHDWIKDTPVVSSIDSGLYTNILYLPFKKINGKYQVIREEVKIEGPLPNCEKIFINTKICDEVSNEEEYLKSGSLVSYKYHGTQIKLPKKLDSIINKHYPKYKEYSEDIICTIYGVNHTLNGRQNNGDDYVPNLITDIIKIKTNSDFAILNYGALRTSWTVGNLTKAQIKSMMPFEDYFCIANVTGKELRQILSVIEIGQKAYYPTSGLKVIMSKSGKKKHFKDVKFWKNGKEIDVEDNKFYIMGSIDYIIESYGDDFKNLADNGFEFRDVKCEDGKEELNWNERIIKALKELGNINLNDYKNSSFPRLVEVTE